MPAQPIPAGAGDALDHADWHRPVDLPFVPPRRRRLAVRPSHLARSLTTLHCASLSAGVLAVDALAAAAVIAAARTSPWWWALALPAVTLLCGYVTNAYRDRDTVQTRGVLWYPGQMLVPVLAMGLTALVAGATGIAGAATLVAAVLTALTLVRCVTWTLLVVLRRRGFGLRRTLIVGDADGGGLLWRRIVEFPEAGLTPTQLVDYATARVPGALARQLHEHAIEHVVLVTPGADEGLAAASLPRHDDDAPFFSVVPALSELFLDPRSVSELGGIPLMPLGRLTRAKRRFPGKRVLDIVVAAAMLLLALPILVVIAIAVKCADGGPVFYRQRRVGHHGVEFRMLKFRTMVVGADAMLASLLDDNISDGLLFKLRDDPRVTRVGRWLRRTSLDELPQVWNVLVGQMSLVGPRPLPVAADAFDDTAAERHTVLPGITGYWQLSGGPELSYDEMVRLDLAYIRNWSLWLDLRLILRTVPALLHRHGAA